MTFPTKLILSVLAVEALGGLGGAITSDQIPGWYAGLESPPGTPPNWLFGPVWILLYAMIGTALAIIWHKAEAGVQKRTALIWFTIQLVLNLVWTPVFFGMHQLLAALIIMVALWLSIARTIFCFRGLDRIASALMFPYLAWVSYATYLNGGYWFLNR